MYPKIWNMNWIQNWRDKNSQMWVVQYLVLKKGWFCFCSFWPPLKHYLPLGTVAMSGKYEHPPWGWNNSITISRLAMFGKWATTPAWFSLLTTRCIISAKKWTMNVWINILCTPWKVRRCVVQVSSWTIHLEFESPLQGLDCYIAKASSSDNVNWGSISVLV